MNVYVTYNPDTDKYTVRQCGSNGKALFSKETMKQVKDAIRRRGWALCGVTAIEVA